MTFRKTTQLFAGSEGDTQDRSHSSPRAKLYKRSVHIRPGIPWCKTSSFGAFLWKFHACLSGYSKLYQMKGGLQVCAGTLAMGGVLRGAWLGVGPSPARVGPNGLPRVWHLQPPAYEGRYRGHLEVHKAGRPGRGRGAVRLAPGRTREEVTSGRGGARGSRKCGRRLIARGGGGSGR